MAMGQTMDISKEVREFPCLHGLFEEEMGDIIKNAEVRTFGRHETIFVESEPVRFFFIVESGLIKLYKTSQDGKELIMNFLRKGEHFCLLLPYVNENHVVSAAALEESTIVMIPAGYFMAFLKAKLGDAGLRIIKGLCHRVKKLSDVIDDLAFKSVDQRVAFTLLRLAEEDYCDKDVIFLSLSHQHIASMVGTVREVVSRAMSRLKKEDVILYTSQKGFILDKTKLVKFLSKKYVPASY